MWGYKARWPQDLNRSTPPRLWIKAEAFIFSFSPFLIPSSPWAPQTRMAVCIEALMHRLLSSGCFKASKMAFVGKFHSKHLFSFLCSSPLRLNGSSTLIFSSVHTEVCPLKFTQSSKVNILGGRFNSLSPNPLWGQAHYVSSFLPLRPHSAALAENNLRGDAAWPGRFREISS